MYGKWEGVQFAAGVEAAHKGGHAAERRGCLCSCTRSGNVAEGIEAYDQQNEDSF